MTTASNDPYAAPSYPGGGTSAGYGGGVTGARPRNGVGTAALVLGVLAIVTSITVIGGIVLGLIGLVLGLIGRGRAKRLEASNGGVALAGVITSVIGIVLAVALIAIGVSVLSTNSAKTFQSCLRSAGSNQAAMQRCDTRYTNSVR